MHSTDYTKKKYKFRITNTAAGQDIILKDWYTSALIFSPEITLFNMSVKIPQT